jgi:hypothetical protein
MLFICQRLLLFFVRILRCRDNFFIVRPLSADKKPYFLDKFKIPSQTFLKIGKAPPEVRAGWNREGSIFGDIDIGYSPPQQHRFRSGSRGEKIVRIQ